MFNFEVCRSFEWQGELTQRVRSVMRMFGLGVKRLRDGQVEHRCAVSVGPGEICFITGASGSGKSVIFREMFAAADRDKKIGLGEIEAGGDKAVIDCFECEPIEAMRALGAAGLSDAFCFLKKPGELSEGQRYRFGLAMAMASGKQIIFADEFCSNLDRITAMTIAVNVRRFATRYKKAFVLASSHEDIAAELEPDVLVIKHLDGRVEVEKSK